MTTVAQMTPQQNLAARQALLPNMVNSTIRRLQPLPAQTINNYVAGQGLTLTFLPATVGIITRFIIRVTANIGNSGGADVQTRVNNGAAAIFSNVTYTDTSNYARVSVPSYYLNQLSMIKRRRKSSGAITMDNNNVDGIGANLGSQIFAAPASLNAAPSTQNFAATFELPLAYSDEDTTGAVLSGLNNSQQSISLTINPNFFVKNTDLVNVFGAGYQSSSALLGQISTLTVQVYQEYLDQYDPSVLPLLDLMTQYNLQVSGGYVPVANTDLVVPYANNRRIISTIIGYNNNGVLNPGTDINYISQRNAGGTDLYKVDPYTLGYLNRARFGDDLPAGFYCMENRKKPIYTATVGNQNIVVNASSVAGAASSIVFGYEQLAYTYVLNASGGVGSGN